jgi:hypothetical protein
MLGEPLNPSACVDAVTVKAIALFTGSCGPVVQLAALSRTDWATSVRQCYLINSQIHTCIQLLQLNIMPELVIITWGRCVVNSVKEISLLCHYLTDLQLVLRLRTSGEERLFPCMTLWLAQVQLYFTLLGCPHCDKLWRLMYIRTYSVPSMYFAEVCEYSVIHCNRSPFPYGAKWTLKICLILLLLLL